MTIKEEIYVVNRVCPLLHVSAGNCMHSTYIARPATLHMLTLCIYCCVLSATCMLVLIAPPEPTAPGPPKDLTLVNRTCHSITFQWSPPDDTGRLDVTGYDILHNGTPVANITGTVYTLAGLTPDTVHTISVRTRNAIGPSVLERTLTAATEQRGECK